jgi:hypothetical protein
MRPHDRFDQAAMWMLFILPSICGRVVWIKGGEMKQFALLAWMIGGMSAVMKRVTSRQ